MKIPHCPPSLVVAEAIVASLVSAVARPGGGAIGKQRQAPVSCSAVDKLRSNSKLTLVHRQRLVEKRKMQKPFKERRSYGEHLVVFQICQGCEILKFMQTPFQ